MTSEKVKLDTRLDSEFNFIAVTDENGWATVMVEGCGAIIGQGHKVAWAVDDAIQNTRHLDCEALGRMVAKFILSK